MSRRLGGVRPRMCNAANRPKPGGATRDDSFSVAFKPWRLCNRGWSTHAVIAEMQIRDPWQHVASSWGCALRVQPILDVEAHTRSLRSHPQLYLTRHCLNYLNYARTSPDFFSVRTAA